MRTSHGLVEYDYLILSGGIRDAWDAGMATTSAPSSTPALRQRLPNQQMFGLKQRVKGLQGRHPGDDAAAAAAPLPALAYEARLPDRLAHQKNKIPGKIVIPRPQTQDRAHRRGLQAGIRGLCPDIITHVPSARACRRWTRSPSASRPRPAS